MDTDTEPTARASCRTRARAAVALGVLLALAGVATALPAGAPAEQASQPTSPPAGRLDTGDRQSCAVLTTANVRCWGYGGDGALGYGNRDTIGDDETPGSVGPVDLGAGRTAAAIAAGDYHVCALLVDSPLLDDSNVRCWGFGGNGRLGYNSVTTIGDDESPGSVGPVDLGLGRTATAISAGGAHTCALLDDGTVRCWGFGFDGQLGRGVEETNSSNSIGDDETPGSVPPVDLDPGLGSGRAVAISAGGNHTCALLDDATVRCWGSGASGRLGYGATLDIGDDETPGSVSPVDLDPGPGFGRAVAISAGAAHTCALLDDATVRCWGFGGNGELGMGNQNTIGNDPGETPGSFPPVDLDPGPGPGRAVAISAGDHTCAILDNGSVRCWGYGGNGRLGYGNASNIGDNETPGSVGPIDLGTNRTAVSVSAGRTQTCARLNDGNVRCWGFAGNGRLGYCNPNNIGDDEAPGSAGPIDLETPGSPCPTPGSGGGPGSGPDPAPGPSGPPTGAPPAVPAGPSKGGGSVDPLVSEARRARDLRLCLASAKRKARRQRDSARRTCMKRYGRTPGRVKGLKGRAASQTKIVLSFTAPGSDGSRPPAARSYLVKQSPTPIRSARDFARAQTLCKGSCRFKVTRIGIKLSLSVTDLRPKTTYYYAIAARDNVSARLGPRSTAVKARTR